MAKGNLVIGTEQLALTFEVAEGIPVRQDQAEPGIPGAVPGSASQPLQAAPAGRLCPRCGSGPIAPGKRCGWCGQGA
jgi:hypothetical protein